MNEISLNSNIANLLFAHGVKTTSDNEFIYAQLSSPLKFKARAIYSELDGYISSQLDVMILTENGERIIESFGDFGADIDTAIKNNLTNFVSGTLYPLLATFDNNIEKYLDHITVESWKINGENWTSVIGNLIPKTNSSNIIPPDDFFNNIVSAIQSQKLHKDLHWFRGYYLQYEDSIYSTEFLMDNINITENVPGFSDIPVIPNVSYYSCRNFIILKRS